MFKPKFNVAKCKTACGLVVGRLKLLKNKKTTQAKQMKREIAELLVQKRNDNAVIRTEAVILQEKMVNALEILELFCELLHVRLALIDKTKEIPTDMREAISSLIFAAHRIPEVPEIKQLAQQLAVKYGKEFAATAAADDPTCRQAGVNEKLIEYLSVQPPPPRTKLDLLAEIARDYNVADFDYQLAAQQLGINDNGEPTGAMFAPPPSQYQDFTAAPAATATPPGTFSAPPTAPSPFTGGAPVTSVASSGGSPVYNDAASAARAAEQFSANAAEAAAAAARYAAAESPAGAWPPAAPAGGVPPPPSTGSDIPPPPGYPRPKTDEEIQREYDAAPGAPPEKRHSAAVEPGPPSAPPAPGQQGGAGSGDLPALPTTPATAPQPPPDLPAIPPQGPQGNAGSMNELDELQKRFEMLKKSG